MGLEMESMMNVETRDAGRAARSALPADEPPTDAELLTRWCAGAEPDALELLIRRHGAMVLGVCRRTLGNSADADDAFQATFLVLVRKARSLARPGQVAGWLHGVALRVARKARANRNRRHQREVMIVDTAAPDPPEDTRELRKILDEEVDRLPEKYRLPIVLCELEGHTLEEAARLLGWPKGTVAGRLSRGREVLRQRLSRRGIGMPLFLAGPLVGLKTTPSHPLVSATLTTATGGGTASSAVANLVNAVLGEWSRRLTFTLLLILTLGVGVTLAWPCNGSTLSTLFGPAQSASCR